MPTPSDIRQKSPRAHLFAKITAEETEKLALEEAEKRQLAVTNTPHGFFRAMLHVLSNKELMSEVARRSRERLERIPLWAQHNGSTH